MFEAIKYRWQLRKLNMQCDKIDKTFKKLKEEASGEDLEVLLSEEGSEMVPVIEEIESLKTKRFYQIAARLMVPIPDKRNKEFWCDRHFAVLRQFRALCRVCDVLA